SDVLSVREGISRTGFAKALMVCCANFVLYIQIIFLIGRDLHRHGKNLIKNSQKFREVVEKLL
ncbi:MAG: hypothetical protein ACTSXH_04360, partial [Promethearchaeota archaeon]